MPIALATMSPVIVGLMALCILLAAIIIIHALDQAATSDTIPGFIRAGLRAFVNAIHWAVNLLTDFFASIAIPGLSLLVAPARAFAELTDALDEAIYNLASRVRFIVNTSIPSIINTIFSQVGALRDYIVNLAFRLHDLALNALGALGNYLRGLIAQVDANLRALIGNVSRTLSTAIASAINALTNLAQSLFRTALAQVARVESSLIARLLSLRTELSTLIARTGQLAVATALGIAIPNAQRYTDAIIGAYRGALDAVAGASLARVWDGILADIDALAHAFPGSLADILSRVGAIPRVRIGDIAGVTSIAVAVGAIGLDWINRCGKSLCQNLNGFGNELAALGDAVMMVEIVALITEAMNDPNGAADHVHDTLTADLTAVGNSFTSILAAA